MMPLVGPVVMSGFLAGLVASMMLSPAIGFAWRERKYMADATAVRLTREPDGLAGALAAISAAGASTRIANWAGHLCVVDPGHRRESTLSGGSYVSVFPPLDRRLRALVRLGASPGYITATAPRKLPHPLIALVAVLLAIVAMLRCVVVVLLIGVSLCLSALFTLLPAVLMHALLR